MTRGGAAVPDVEEETEVDEEVRERLIPPWHVVLIDDDEHSYGYVIEMLGKLFSMTRERAYAHAREVDSTGRTILLTTSRERAELKRDQIHAYGPDPRNRRCKGSMRAVVEPAEG